MTLDEICEHLPELVDDIRKSDRESSLAALASLLLQPEIQSNNIRIEGLVHLVDAYADGREKPKTSTVSSWFDEFGSFIGALEDPAEDIFVGYIGTSSGGYRALEGFWEGNSFYTEIVIRAIEKIPADSIREELTRPSYALLKLSDLISERAKLHRYQPGNDIKQKQLPRGIASSVYGNRKKVILTDKDLAKAEISKEQLRPFIKNERVSSETDFLEDSPLHRQPLLEVENGLICILPTAIGMAIRLHVINTLHSWGLQHHFQRVICAVYSEFFEDQSILGHPPEVPIGPMAPGVFSGGFIKEFDTGRFLHFLPIVSPIDEIVDKGMLCISPPNMDLSEYMDQRCLSAYDAVSGKESFVEILHLICIGGVGAGLITSLTEQKNVESRVVMVPAHDLRILSELQDFDLAEIIRILDMRDQDRDQGLDTINLNGFMNLAGWLKANDGFTLPPHISGVELGDGIPFMMNFDSNMQRNLRIEAYSARDTHRVSFVDGSQSLVSLYGKSIFPEDETFPVYVEAILRGSHGIRLLVKCGEKQFWAVSVVDEKLHHQLRFQKFEVVKTWLPRIIRALSESYLIAHMPTNTLVEIAFDIDPKMNKNDSSVSDAFELSMDDIKSLPLEIEIEKLDANSIRLSVPSSFDKKCFLKENIAEVILVEAFIKGLARLSGQKLSDIELRRFTSDVVPNEQARQAHTFLVSNFRQSMVGRLPETPKINVQDHARMTASEAWLYHSKKDGFEIKGKTDCGAFLNSATQGAIDKLIADLSVFDREALLSEVARYYEAINVNKTRWRLTASASVGLCRDQDSARDIIAKHEGELAGGLTGCRIVLEAGLFETKKSGGRKPGRLDIERLILRALHVFQLGGFSDGVRWDVTPPNIQISPQGQIQIDQSFNREVVELLALKVAKANIEQSIEDYGSQNIVIKSEDEAPIDLDERENTFMEALKAEWGLELETVLTGVHMLEREGMKLSEPVFTLNQVELQNALGVGLNSDEVEVFLDTFVFPLRDEWQTIPNGIASDMFPWRFRRKSSILRQPILDISTDKKKRYLIIPGLIEEAVKHQYGLMYEGAARVASLHSKEMKRWVEVEIGHHEALRFENRMAKKIEDEGYDVKASVKLTQIFERPLDRNYGDIDILVWNENKGLVWIIECKNFSLRKTPGELAEQLSNFRGEVREGKRDLLRKHLDRVDLLRANHKPLCKFLGLSEIKAVKSVLLFPNPVPMQFSKIHCQGSDILLVEDLKEYFTG